MAEASKSRVASGFFTQTNFLENTEFLEVSISISEKLNRKKSKSLTRHGRSKRKEALHPKMRPMPLLRGRRQIETGSSTARLHGHRRRNQRRLRIF